MDTLRLENIDLYAHHGVAPQERELGQHFLVDVELFLDMTAAATSDDLKQTIDYAAVYETISDAFCNKPQQLIERAAWVVLEALFHKFDVEEIAIRVRKLSPPMAGAFDGAVVELLRTREEVLGD
jgi:dihydroneopterin aldolase